MFESLVADGQPNQSGSLRSKQLLSLWQCAEPGDNVGLKQVATWGVQAQEGAVFGLTCTAVVRIGQGDGTRRYPGWRATLAQTLAGGAASVCRRYD